MAQIHVDTLKKLRTKVLEQRRAMALRQSSASQAESLELMVRVQSAIEAIDRAIADEERQLKGSESEPLQSP
jgi:hypothetical protein